MADDGSLIDMHYSGILGIPPPVRQRMIAGELSDDLTAVRRQMLQELWSDLLALETRIARLSHEIQAVADDDTDLQARMHHNKVVVALANKIARITGAVLVKPGATYRRIEPALT